MKKESHNKYLLFQSLFLLLTYFPLSRQQNNTFSFKIAGPDRNMYHWALRVLKSVLVKLVLVFILPSQTFSFLNKSILLYFMDFFVLGYQSNSCTISFCFKTFLFSPCNSDCFSYSNFISLSLLI